MKDLRFKMYLIVHNKNRSMQEHQGDQTVLQGSRLQWSRPPRSRAEVLIKRCVCATGSNRNPTRERDGDADVLATRVGTFAEDPLMNHGQQSAQRSTELKTLWSFLWIRDAKLSSVICRSASRTNQCKLKLEGGRRRMLLLPRRGGSQKKTTKKNNSRLRQYGCCIAELHISCFAIEKVLASVDSAGAPIWGLNRPRQRRNPIGRPECSSNHLQSAVLTNPTDFWKRFVQHIRLPGFGPAAGLLVPSPADYINTNPTEWINKRFITGCYCRWIERGLER